MFSLSLFPREIILEIFPLLYRDDLISLLLVPEMIQAWSRWVCIVTNDTDFKDPNLMRYYKVVDIGSFLDITVYEPMVKGITILHVLKNELEPDTQNWLTLKDDAPVLSLDNLYPFTLSRGTSVSLEGEGSNYKYNLHYFMGRFKFFRKKNSQLTSINTKGMPSVVINDSSHVFPLRLLDTRRLSICYCDFGSSLTILEAPLLERLYIKFCKLSEIRFEIPRFLELECTSPRFLETAESFNVERVRELKLTKYIDWGNLSRLNRLKNLEKLTISTSLRFASIECHIIRDVVLPNLKSLEFLHSSRIKFKNCHFPSLKEFRLIQTYIEAWSKSGSNFGNIGPDEIIVD